MKKTIFFDIDGTILPISEDGQKQAVPASTITAIQQLKANGHRIVIATGKAIFMIYPLLDELKIEFDYLIGSNGQVVIKRQAGCNEIIFEDFMPAEDLVFIND